MIPRITSLLIGYVFGCFLTADIVSRRLAHKSAFDLGIGNPGMANVGAELGVSAALLVLAGDITKTLISWLIARALWPQVADIAGVWAGLGATFGHNYPIWHHFHGGKGVTTTCSAIVLASPVVGVVSCLIGAAAVLISGYLCVGALTITFCYFVLSALVIHSTERIAIAGIFLILMTLAHGGPLLGIRDGSTPVAGISTKVRNLIHRKQL